MGQNAPYLCIAKRVTEHGVYSNFSEAPQYIWGVFVLQNAEKTIMIVSVQKGAELWRKKKSTALSLTWTA